MNLNSYEKWKSSAASLADDLMEAGKTEEARLLFGKILLVNPGETEARHRHLKTSKLLNKTESCRSEALFLSLLTLREEKAKETFEILSDLLEQFPDDVNVKLKLAKLAVVTGQEDKAESLYSSLGKYYLDKSLPQKAIDAYRQIIILNQDKFEYYQKIAAIFVQEGMTQSAVAQYFELIQHYLEKQMTDDAAALLEKVLILDSTNKQAAVQLAQVHLQKGKMSDASRVIRNQLDNRMSKGLVDEAVQLNQEWIDLLARDQQMEQVRSEREYMATQLFSRERKEQAVVLFEQIADDELSAEHVDRFLEFMQQVVSYHLMQGNIGKAKSGYQKIIMAIATRDKEKGKAFVEEFVSELLQREKIRELDQALREMAAYFEGQGDKKQSEELLARLAEIYVSIYKLQEAIKVYKLIAEKGGEDPKTYLALAELYVKEEKLGLAQDSYMEAIKIYTKTGQFVRAEETFRTASAKDPKNPALLSRMGAAYYGLGEWDKALGYYQEALDLDPYFRQAVVGTAMAYAKKGMLDEMVSLAKRLVTKGVIAEIIEEYKKALSMSSKEAEGAMALGLLYKDLGFMEEAILEFQKASKDSKYFLRACNQLGLCFRGQGFGDLAIRQYRKALERSGYSEEEALEIRYNLAGTYEDVKMYREAHELYNDILVVDIGYKDAAARSKNLGSAGTSGKVVSLPSDRESGGKKT